MRHSYLRKNILLTRNILILLIIFSVLFLYNGMIYRKNKLSDIISKNALKFLLFKDHQNHGHIKSTVIKQWITKYNSRERISNIKTYGPVKSDTTIIVVTVRNDIRYLKYLLMSLADVKGIENSLLIFSHSHFDDTVNNMIRTIDFCRVMQLFYPYSVQIYPNSFPGPDARDCPYNMNIQRAISMNCTGAFNPDIHGRYRLPEHSESKHHWWWTANKVFEGLTCTEDHDGIVLFLEDDVFVTQDFLYMAISMKKAAASVDRCELLSLGAESVALTSEKNNTHMLEVATWNPGHYSMALVFDLKVWNNIASHYDLFCHVDDYSWSRSLLFLSLYRKYGGPFRVMTSVIPRAYKIKTRFQDYIFNVGLLSSVYEVLNLQVTYRSLMFPPHLEVYVDMEMEDEDYIVFDYVKGNGGWSDPRDRDLCCNITVCKIKKILLDMINNYDDFEHNNKDFV